MNETAELETAAKLVRTTFRIHPATLAWLEQQAVDSREGKSGIVRQALQEYRDRHSDDMPARLATHQPAMRGFRVTEVPLGAIMSVYGTVGPEEVVITDRYTRDGYVWLEFSNGSNFPYDTNALVHAFAPLVAVVR